MMNSSLKVLGRNNYFYNYFINKKILEVEEELDENGVVERIMFLAKFAWRNHSGYYYDGRLENILFNYGKNLEKYVDKEKIAYDIKTIFPQSSSNAILHLATELGEVGGHTRVLYQILKRNEDREQIIVLTDQSIKKVPKWFIDGIGTIPIVTLDSISSIFDRAYILRYISGFSKKIILYHHPFDAVPVIAYSHDRCPPVLLENHAHSWFWFGSSVADMVFVHSKFHMDFTHKTRTADKVHLLPVTQIDDMDLTFDTADKVKAKEKLHINPDTTCIITVGTPDKFIPNAQYNFFKTAHKIIDRFDNVEIFIIGINNSETYCIDTDRIHFLGPVSDPSDYYKAADICLDALPQPSLGGTFFSTLIGMACPLHKYGKANVFNCRNLSESKLYGQHIGTPQNENKYLDKLEFLIKNPDIRIQIAEEIRDEYIRMYSKESLAKHIKQMLRVADDLEHTPRMIPAGIYHHDADSAEIADAGFLQDLCSTLDYFDSYLSRRERITILIQLSTKLVHTLDVMKLVKNLLINRIKSFDFNLRSGRRFSWPD
jgi:glycosyltransferase involved in cell wall biosynthesis